MHKPTNLPQRHNGGGDARPLWLLAELTYACPLQCPHCFNPTELACIGREMATADWLRVLREARQLGAAQLGLSGGEPLVRQDLEEIVAEAHTLGYYTNLITSGIGMDDARLVRLKEAGLDHIQLSFQAGSRELNNFIGGTDTFDKKKAVARAIKAHGYPMVLNVVLSRKNIDQIDDILAMAETLEADYVELANTQYYGWAFQNREALLPTREQLAHAEKVTNKYRERLGNKMELIYVVPDYYEDRPKPCMSGWGDVFLGVAPDGVAIPCHSARILPGIYFPNVREHSIEDIWCTSEAFNRFRGFDWMEGPCRSCAERFDDYGGCRCQAYLLTGDMDAADPVCSKSPEHWRVTDAVARVNGAGADGGDQPLLFRNPKNSKRLHPAGETDNAT